MDWTILVGDVLARLRELPSESVHCCVTSPPYWGLRDYGSEGQMGLERTPEEYIAKMVDVFREVRRVLRSDGTCWVNMGDSYASGGRSSYDANAMRRSGDDEIHPLSGKARPDTPEGLKPKDLCGIPWMLAFALRADGWYLRSDIIWHKPNPMPESVADRPTKSHEYIFLLTKSERYFYDAEAIKEPAICGDPRKPYAPGQVDARGNGHDRGGGKIRESVKRGGFNGKTNELEGREAFRAIEDWRNKRTVWTIATQPFPEAHFATFPEELITPCILAGTSEKGCCSACGAPWERIVEPSEQYAKALGKGYTDHKADLAEGMQQVRGENRQNKARDEFGIAFGDYCTVGWEPTCECKAGMSACVVLDPFAGSGTTGVVALRYHRAFIGIELNPEYAAMARRRILDDQPLFNTGGHSETLPAAAPHQAAQALLVEARPEETEADRGLASPKGSPQGQSDDRTTEEGL